VLSLGVEKDEATMRRRNVIIKAHHYYYYYYYWEENSFGQLPRCCENKRGLLYLFLSPLSRCKGNSAEVDDGKRRHGHFLSAVSLSTVARVFLVDPFCSRCAGVQPRSRGLVGYIYKACGTSINLQLSLCHKYNATHSHSLSFSNLTKKAEKRQRQEGTR